ncbi:MAG: DUF4159 domain-containing protein [Ignavibacteriales bacterium]|nr:DUF4159 domain-containing protein [Ignavibacteriales bacterium]
MQRPANKFFSYFNFSERNLLANLTFASSKWRVYYQRAFGYGVLFSLLLHLLVVGTFYVMSEKGDPNARRVKIKTYYEKIAPPVKYEPTPPKLVKSFDLVKEQNMVQDVQPKDYAITEAPLEDVRTADIRPTTLGSNSSVGGQGSVFHGALSSGESSGAEGWSIPAGTKSYGRSLGRGGSGGTQGGNDNSMGYGPDIAMEVTNTRASGRASTTYSDQLIDESNFKDRFEGDIKQGANKKDVKGFLNLYQLRYRSSKAEGVTESWNFMPMALQNLGRFAETKTKIEIVLRGQIRLDDKLVLEVPIVYMMGNEGAPLMSPVEIKNLATYLRGGGFLFIDDGYAFKMGAFNQKMRSILEQALGYDAEWERIPSTHKLYHAWEDFSGPPAGSDDIPPQTGQTTHPMGRPVPERYPYLEGIFLNGRLAVVLSSKGYCRTWDEWYKSKVDNVRQLQFGLNVVVFACTQKGGIIDRNKEKIANQK